MIETRASHVGFVGAFALLVATVGHAGEDPDATLAKLTDVSGTVLLDNGRDYTIAATGLSLMDGHRIFVLEESTATLSLNDGCLAEVVGPTSHAFTPNTTCEDLRALQPSSLDAVAAEAAASPQAELLQQAGTSQYDERTAGLIGLGIAGAGGVGWALSNGLGSDDRDPPAAAFEVPIEVPEDEELPGMSP